MTDLAYDNLRHLKLWHVALPNPFMTAMLLCCALMYAIYCLGVGIPESVLPLCFVVVLPFFKEKDFLALGACLPLISGIPHFRVFLIFVVLVYFLKYFNKFKIQQIWGPVIGFVSIEIFDGMKGSHFELLPFLGWAGGMFYFALCINLLTNIKPNDLLKIMKYYAITWCCTTLIVLQRFYVELGGLQNLLLKGGRLGDLRKIYGVENVGLSFNPNTLSLFSVICLGICLVFIYLHYGNCSLWVGIACLASAVVLMTLSRGGMVMWTAVMLIYFVDMKSLKKIIFLTPAILIFAAGLMYVLYGYSDAFAMMVDNMIGRFTMNGDISAGRLDLWEMWNDYFFSTPSAWLTGIGSNSIMERIDSIGIGNCIHGGFQETYVYWGVIGFALMIALNCSIYRIAKKSIAGPMTKFNFLLMIAVWLQLSKGQYMSGDYVSQIIAAVAMAYPFWRHKNEFSNNSSIN